MLALATELPIDGSSNENARVKDPSALITVKANTFSPSFPPPAGDEACNEESDIHEVNSQEVYEIRVCSVYEDVP